MKTLLFLLLFVSFSASAQFDYYEKPSYSKPVNKPVLKLVNKTDSLEYQLNYVQRCTDKFVSQHNTGCVFATIGSISGIVGLYYTLDDVKIGNYYIIGGLVMTTIGGIIKLDSYKWLRRASISPFPDGVGIKYNF